MKLIFNMINGKPYLYKEDEAHFNRVDPERRAKSTLMENTILEQECDMDFHGDNYYLIFDIVDPETSQG